VAPDRGNLILDSPKLFWMTNSLNLPPWLGKRL
jgi:hypothetical protein